MDADHRRHDSCNAVSLLKFSRKWRFADRHCFSVLTDTSQEQIGHLRRSWPCRRGIGGTFSESTGAESRRGLLEMLAVERHRVLIVTADASVWATSEDGPKPMKSDSSSSREASGSSLVR